MHAVTLKSDRRHYTRRGCSHFLGGGSSGRCTVFPRRLHARRCSPRRANIARGFCRGIRAQVASRHIASRHQSGTTLAQGQQRIHRYKDHQSRGAEGYSLVHRRTRVHPWLHPAAARARGSSVAVKLSDSEGQQHESLLVARKDLSVETRAILRARG